MTNMPAYTSLKELVKLLGGDIEWKSGGHGGGGSWTVTMPSSTLDAYRRLFGVAESKKLSAPEQWMVRVPPGNCVNALDGLYVAKVPNPQTWDDYERSAPLKPDAIYQFVQAEWQ